MVTVREVADCRNLTDGRTDGRTDIKCLSNGRQNLITLTDQTKKNVSKFSRNMFTEIRCEICINHIYQFTTNKSVKKLYRHPLVDINNINVPGQRICSHFLVQIPRADAEIVTNKLPLIFFFNMLLLYFNVQYTNAYFY